MGDTDILLVHCIMLSLCQVSISVSFVFPIAFRAVGSKLRVGRLHYQVTQQYAVHSGQGGPSNPWYHMGSPTWWYFGQSSGA